MKKFIPRVPVRARYYDIVIPSSEARLDRPVQRSTGKFALGVEAESSLSEQLVGVAHVAAGAVAADEEDRRAVARLAAELDACV
jgi:hypothetical protein